MHGLRSYREFLVFNLRKDYFLYFFNSYYENIVISDNTDFRYKGFGNEILVM